MRPLSHALLTHLWPALAIAAAALLLSPTAAIAAPVVAAQATDEAARGQQLFNEERWGEAALILKRVADGATGATSVDRKVAQYHLAVSLYRLQFYQASYGIFAEIADEPAHPKFSETLLWLSRLATQLPEPADIIERVGKYKSAELARLDNPQQRGLYWQLNYLLGRYKYRNRLYEEAIALFEKVDKRSEHYAEAELFSGIAYVQLRKSVPAVKAFQRVVQAIDEGAEGVAGNARLRDLAFLSIARAYYSASIHIDTVQAPTLDSVKLRAAIKYWDRIDVIGEHWLDGLFEQSWAYFMVGDYPHALGNLHTLEAPYFPGAFYPEAEVLRAVISFTLCQYDDATTIVARMKQKYEPERAELSAVLHRFQGEDGAAQFFQFLKDVRAGKAGLSPTLQPVVLGALSDREILRHLEYVRVLDEEDARFRRAPASFKSSPLGNDVADALSLARELAVRNAGALARERCLRTLEELKDHLGDAAKLLTDIAAARTAPDKRASKSKKAGEKEPASDVQKPDHEHVVWPFDGEYWRDELTYYRQAVTSKCPN